MIQRIQSLFFLLSGIASGMMLVKPLLGIDVPGGVNGILYADAIKSAGSGDILLASTPLFILISIISLISFISIFLYKKRMMQLRITVYNMILMVGLIGLGYFYAKKGAMELSGSIELMFYSIMPVVSFILSLLAWRGVRRDYLMLKAVERIR